jgi:hypothetical protein
LLHAPVVAIVVAAIAIAMATVIVVATAAGVVHANVGKNVTPHNPSLGLFLYHFLHTMSL